MERLQVKEEKLYTCLTLILAEMWVHGTYFCNIKMVWSWSREEDAVVLPVNLSNKDKV